MECAEYKLYYNTVIMITSSIVLYCTKATQLNTIIDCVVNSPIDHLFVIDNSPTNDLKDVINYDSNKIEYVYNNKNLGYGGAHNVAIRRAFKLQASYHVVLNPDIEFKPSVINTILNYLNRNIDVGQVLPKVLYPDGRIQYLCKMIPTPIDLIFKRFLPSRLTEKRLHKFQLRFTGYNEMMNVPYLSGCFMFFRVSALKDIGLFDERFFMYPEDIDITRRMHKKYKTIFYPEVSIIHAHAAESYKSNRMFWVHISNMVKYFNKWGWFFDKERRCVNKQLLIDLKYRK